MSLLLAEGHRDARSYPLAHVWSEVRIVRQRNAQRRKLDMVLMQQVLSSMFTEKAAKVMKATLEGMDESD